MTEAEWLASSDPAAMIQCLENGEPTDGKRHTSPCPDTEKYRRLMRRWVEACREATDAKLQREFNWPRIEPHNNISRLVEVWAKDSHGDALPMVERAHFVREVFGNPWRPVVTCRRALPCDARCRCLLQSWLTPAALSLARAAWGECQACNGRGGTSLDPWKDECPVCHGTGDGPPDWSVLGPLADALEEAGCDSEELLAHLRSPGPHCRGCWALALILGKE